MKINVEVDITPEEMRQVMGLPDVQGWQQQMIENFSAGFQQTQEEQQELMRNMFTGMAFPMQDMFFNLLGSATKSKPQDDQG